MRKFGSTENKIIPIIFLLILIFIWVFVVEMRFVEKYILPSPIDVVITLVEILPDLKPHIIVTMREATIGLSISIILALLTAILMDLIAVFKKAMYPLLVISQSIPTIAVAPLFVIWFGFGELPKIIVVVMVCFFPIVINLVEGLSSVDKEMINLMKSMGVNSFKMVRYLKLPASMPHFFSGLKISASYCIMGAVIGEWLGGSAGIGFYMIRVKKSFDLNKTFAVILVIIFLSVLLFKFIELIQKKFNWNMK